MTGCSLVGVRAMNYYILTVAVVAVVNSNELSNLTTNDRQLYERDSTEFRLTKLLNIELGGEPTKLDTDLKKAILSAVKTGFEESPERERTGPCVPQANCSNTEVAVALRELYSEITALKKNLSNIVNHPNSECLVQSDILEGKSFPVGTNYHRVCHPGSLNKEITEAKKYFPRSCKEIQEKGNKVSGIYQIQPKMSEKPFMVLCDMETRGGGWTHIQKRYDGSVDFYLDWREYKFGFGDLGGEFWLGLENMYKLTGFEVNELLIELVDRENKTAHVHYKAFGIGPETEGYPLNTLRDFTGDGGASDALKAHLGMKFTTKDFDQDTHPDNCAVVCRGGWWFYTCHDSNLNGKYINAVLPDSYKYHSMFWAGLGDVNRCLAKSRMMVRPIG